MQLKSTAMMLVMSGALCAGARAQDSISKIHGMPGDAVSSRLAAEQVNDFIVDQTVLRSSWGTVFGVAPIIKTGAVRVFNPDFFNSLADAQYLSRLTKSGATFARTSYGLWSGQGFGVNDDPTLNDPPTAVNATGFTGFQVGVACGEFSTGTVNPASLPASLNNVIGGVVNFTDARPSRLYVSRIVAAANSNQDGCNLAAIGMGSVDEDGNVHFRSDNFNAVSCGGFTAITGNNLFRIKMLSRNAATVNVLSNTGGADAAATDWLLANAATTQNCPNMIPTLLGTRPILIGANFSSQYVFEQVAGSVVTTGTHLAAGAVNPRGNVGYSPRNFTTLLGPSTNGTAAILTRTTAGSGDASDKINLWGLGLNGTVSGTRVETLPAAVTDPVQVWSSTNIAGPQEFDHYHSQTAFNGGSGQVAIGRDQQGNLIAAATVYYGLTYTATPPALVAHLAVPNNYIAVVRTTPAGVSTWSTAGWTQETTAPVVSDGKTIFDGSMNAIGRLTGARFGPAISAPMIDSVGNVWFLAAIDLTLSGDPTSPVGLIRAVYDATTFSYKLELVLKQGQILQGRNSNTPYKIQFLDIKDSNSISSGCAWSGNISASAFKNVDPSTLNVADSETLGGLVLSASIIYDVNGDSLYQRSVGTMPTVGSPDEDYQVLLYLSSSRDDNMNDVPDDADNAGPGQAYCFGDGLDPNVTNTCPCGNNGQPGRGCRTSFNSAGARLYATGQFANEGGPVGSGVVLRGEGMNLTNGQICIFLKGDMDAADGIVFGDGVRCATGNLLRMRTEPITPNALPLGGTSAFPMSGDPQSLSLRGGTPVTSGLTGYYTVYFRNSAVFCTAETFNTSNGYRITW